MKPEYGELIKKFRKDRLISQIKLETAADLCFGTLSRIESGKINPTKETLFKIVFVLKLNNEEALELFGIKNLLKKN